MDAYLARLSGQIRLHYLPTYSRETNCMERVWWHVHEALTRDHRCQTLEELVVDVYAWFGRRSHPCQ